MTNLNELEQKVLAATNLQRETLKGAVEAMIAVAAKVRDRGTQRFLLAEIKGCHAVLGAPEPPGITMIIKDLRTAVDGLKSLAEQKTVAEMEEASQEEYDGDMEGAYETMIDVARTTLKNIQVKP